MKLWNDAAGMNECEGVPVKAKGASAEMISHDQPASTVYIRLHWHRSKSDFPSGLIT